MAVDTTGLGEQLLDPGGRPGSEAVGDLEVELVHAGDATGSVRAVARPRTPAGRAREVNAPAWPRSIPGTAADLCALAHDDAVPAAGGHHPVGPVHRRAGQHGHPGALRRLPRRRGPGRRRSRPDVEEIIRSTASSGPRPKNLIGMAGAVADRFGGEVPSRLEDLVTLPGCRAQDGQCGAQRGLRPARPPGGHPRRAPVPPAGPDHRDGPGQGRAGAQPDGARRGAGCVQPAADPPRAADLPGPLAAVRRVAAWPTSARLPASRSARRSAVDPHRKGPGRRPDRQQIPGLPTGSVLPSNGST